MISHRYGTSYRPPGSSHAPKSSNLTLRLLAFLVLLFLVGLVVRQRDSQIAARKFLDKGKQLLDQHLSSAHAEEDALVKALQEEMDEDELVSADPGKVLALMKEGVVEDPDVDHDPDPEIKESPAVMDVEAPSQEEIDSGVNEEKAHEEEEFEEPAISDDATQMPPPANALAKPGSRITLQAQVKGPKAYKMVNSHFLALIDAWTHAGWTRMSDSAFTSGVSLLLTKPVTVVPGSRGKMISQISTSACLGGTKGAQLSCRSKFALQHQCTFDSLAISPMQFDMWRAGDCERFFEMALKPENADMQWIGKLGASYHGRHITIYKGVTKTIKTSYGKCKLNRETGGGYIMQAYVSSPALLGGRKFDLRTFLLIASTDPYLVFYHKGFIRRSATAYSSDALGDKLAHITNAEAQDGASDDHFAGFDFLEAALASELGFPADYMRTRFRARARKVTNFVFQAARSRLKRRPGAYMLFGLDWMIDKNQGVHLLEANGNPVVRHYPNTDNLTPQVWRDMAGLLTAVHMDPDALKGELSVKSGFAFGGWELVFSEPEELATGNLYYPCKDVAN